MAASTMLNSTCAEASPDTHQLVGDLVQLTLDAEVDFTGPVLYNEAGDEALVDLRLQLNVLAAGQLLRAHKHVHSAAALLCRC